MKFVALISLLVWPLALNAQESVPEGFTPLFNGKDLEGWFGHGTADPRTLWSKTPEELAKHQESTMADVNAHWKVVDGILENDGKGLYLTTKKDYGDFELLVDYKTVPLADSGIYLRGVPQVQIWDSTEEKKFKLGADKGSGGLWNNSKGAPGKDPLKKMDKPFGEWNSFRIKMIGERVSVWLNGTLVVDHAIMENYFTRKEGLRMFPKGPIQLQTHGGPISWKNVHIREIGAEEANAWLTEKSGGKFKSLFNGENLDGWMGATDNYEVVDGAIRCKAGKGGNLLYDEEFGDAHYRFEFKLPPGGNNGIALRTPDAKNNPAYAGLEVQVLDDTHPKYEKLKPYQFHGSVYTLVPALRGYLRPVGEWNYEEIIYQGSHIKVILNGTVIVDADLAKIDAPKHKGKERTSGYFGFAGHNDPVAYRNLCVRKLDPKRGPKPEIAGGRGGRR